MLLLCGTVVQRSGYATGLARYTIRSMTNSPSIPFILLVLASLHLSQDGLLDR
jgi:hypothetical protein